MILVLTYNGKKTFESGQELKGGAVDDCGNILPQ
jgi:hypothetical protein